jgi:hypothetical protein
MSLLPVGFGASGDDYEITDSLRIRNSASASLQRYNATETNRRTFTYSGWFKLGYLNNDYWFQSARYDVNNFTGITINLNQGLGIYQKNGGSITWILREAGVKRDFSGWYHFVVAVDTTQSTSTDRVKLYVNGVLSTSFTSASYPSQNLDTFFNTTTAVQTFAQSATTGNAQWDGYVTETHFIDGQQLTADDFGEYDANGTWKAKRYTGTYGTNGFYLPMKPTTQAELQNTVLYTGQGSNAPQSINGYGFTPDLVWIKSRVTSYGHALFDSIRGPNARLQSDTTGAETVSGTYLTSLDSDGFTLASDYGQNAPNEPYVAWGWDAGDNQPSTGHSSITWTGSGNVGTREFSGFGFSPDLVWIKGRTYAGSHQLYDTVRGGLNKLWPNLTSAESSTNTYGLLSSFTNDGFIATQGSSDFQEINNSGSTFVAWGWDAGDGDPVSNTDGSITSTVKANPDKGFSIVTYTGTGANATVGHGLGVAPSFLIVRARDNGGATNWAVWHSSFSSTEYSLLNSTAAKSSSGGAALWNSTVPTSTVFSIGTDTNTNYNTKLMVAYCFSEVSGVSKFGSYSGTGSAGNAITGLGFKPGFLMVKRTNSTGNWFMLDSTRNPFNSADSSLAANSSSAEVSPNSSVAVDFDSDGFTIQSTGNGINASSSTYIYMAFKGSYSDYVSPLNTDGTIDSRVKANPDKGFSIVSYEGTGANATVGHGLSSPLEMLIVKSRDNAFSWGTWHTGIAATEWLKLQDTAAKATLTTAWNSTAPTNSVFSLGSSGSTNNNNSNFIAYCFHSVAGYSKFDSYTGNGSTTGPVVTTGFRPAFVMIKRSDSTGNWTMLDNTRSVTDNAIDDYLWANLSNAESTNTTADIEFTDTGFQIKNTTSDQNASGGTYIYMAFADTRDAVFNFDASGNKNNFDVLGSINSNAESETTYDLMKDTPSLVDENAANFATLNPLRQVGGATITDGNLTLSGSDDYTFGTIALPSSGKFYYEMTCGAVGNTTAVGVADSDAVIAAGDLSADIRIYASNGYKYTTTGGVLYGSTYTTGDVIGVACDMTNNTISFYKNNVSQGNAFTDLADTTRWIPYLGAFNATGGGSINFGQRPFAYTPPTGFLKLNTFNLPDSTIEDGSQHFETLTRNGFGSSGGTVATNFQADLIWEKPRNAAYSHYIIDNVRGIANGTAPFLSSNTNSAEQNANWYLPPTSSTIGFNSSDWSTSTTVVDWIWKANGSSVSNTVGDITSTVSANTTAGFSIVGYAGNNGSNQTVGHGLGTTPSMFIIKNRTVAASWAVYHKDIPTPLSNAMYLNSTNAVFSWAYWGTGGLSSTVFPVNYGSSDATNQSGKNYIAYCFAEVEGYSSFDSYTGNGSTDGPFVYTGFRPAWVLVKNSNSSTDWTIFDAERSSYNVIDDYIVANTAAAEYTNSSIVKLDFTSNGFKVRGTWSGMNGSGNTIIYMAFAENPFKNANAR